MKNQVTIEKKITFVVAGIEFENLKVAQFFKRYVTAVQAMENQISAREVMLRLRRALDMTDTNEDDTDVIEAVMYLQMPKPARKKNPQAFQRRDFKTFPKKKVQVLAGDPQTKQFWDEHHAKNQFLEPTLDEQEEAIDAFDTTFAKVSTPFDVTPKTTSEYL